MSEPLFRLVSPESIRVKVVRYGDRHCRQLQYRDPFDGRKITRSAGTRNMSLARQRAGILEGDLIDQFCVCAGHQCTSQDVVMQYEQALVPASDGVDTDGWQKNSAGLRWFAFCSPGCRGGVISEVNKAWDDYYQKAAAISNERRLIRGCRLQLAAVKKFLSDRNPEAFDSLPKGFGPALTSQR